MPKLTGGTQRTGDRPGLPAADRLSRCPRRAGSIRAADTHWALTNRNRNQTYVAENPEGAGEHITFMTACDATK
ncbi:hypothetical protein SAMN05216266_113154 [Amycolatopsis marina]|uniref:Uncharacterized protein n=1 Tax=Amycolatopsis marina TaxID=490629 RepID=A0A1I1BFJ3_9PSEU|nr:hypothetical protein SAMN05216266_113154 [Amycolatopsis marina]